MTIKLTSAVLACAILASGGCGQSTQSTNEPNSRGVVGKKADAIKSTDYGEVAESPVTKFETRPNRLAADRKRSVLRREGLAKPAQVVNMPLAEAKTEGLELFEEARESDLHATEAPSNESYEAPRENDFLAALDEPLSTFSIDVDTASYSNVRRFLRQGSLPPADAVRIEELINYFNYDYPQPADDEPFAVHVELTECPWQPKHRLAKIGLQGRTMEMEDRPASNLVFLLDVSGSMQSQNKLPLVKKAMEMLVEQLDQHDRIAVVVYASSTGIALQSTPGDEKEVILSSLDALRAGGSTNGSGGIQLAYQVARENYIDGGVNRVILCTDGDFNVGITDRSELTNLITRQAKQGTFLSVLGFGMGNLKDSTMEQLADKGNGHYAYIDSRQEARKVLVDQAAGTLVTIAKDVKIQVDFNPAAVSSYRLIGYENRMLAAEDFRDDTKDAGEIGAGHSVTALYEIIPVGIAEDPIVEPSKYTESVETVEETPLSEAALLDELLTVRLRYKQPEGDESTEFRVTVMNTPTDFAEASGDMQFATAVAEFGLLLKNSEYRGSATFDDVIEIASTNAIDDHGYRAEFLKLAIDAKRLSDATSPQRDRRIGLRGP